MNQDKEIYNTNLFFELSADLFFIAGFDGYWKKINKAAIEFLGYSEEELLSKPILFFIYEEDKDLTLKNRENILKGIPLINFENRYVTKTGEIVWLSWTSMPSDNSKLIYAVAKDITHKKKLEEERSILLTNLKNINKSLKNSTYTASHDMRAPVNNLISVFELIDISKIKDEETLGFIKIMKEATSGLKENLNSYLDNINNETISQKVEILSFEVCLKKVYKSIDSLIKNSNTTISIDFNKVETILFNKISLESIFLNLITNSIKYSIIGLSPKITISTHEKNGIKQLIYKDNGRGFDLENINEKIFERNQKYSTNSDSSGIGLYLIYNHIKEMGATIQIESEINKGTTFTISFKS